MKCPAAMLVVLGFGLVAGCGTINRASAPWKVVVADGPWSAPGKHAVLESRQYWAGPMDAGVTADERFRGPDGRNEDADRVARSLVGYLEKTGELQRWPETGSHINSRAQRLAPYRFYVVSLFPTVAVLGAREIGPVKNRSTYELVGNVPKGALSDVRVLNHIEIGTEISESNDLFWVSPDLKVPITKIKVDADGRFEIRNAGVELSGRKVGTVVFVERLK